jgi:NADP-dependent aldehyde dehydrogenase
MRPIHSIDPRTGSKGPAVAIEFPSEDVDRVCRDAKRAMPSIADPADRVRLLSACARILRRDAETIAAIADRETALGLPRLTGEVERAAAQMAFLAEVVEEGSWRDITIDSPDPTATPPRASLLSSNVPIGPVAVFGASNFPIAFSVPGGDTASALAAGCATVVKAHPSHPATSEATHARLQEAAASVKLPEALIGLVHGLGAGADLVRHDAIEAVAYTGSLQGGRRLLEIATLRPRPIPFFGELGSVNPVVLTRRAAIERMDAFAEGLVTSMTLGQGQFCTSPGLVLCPSDHLESLVIALETRVGDLTPGHMLNSGIATTFEEGVARVGDLGARVTTRARDLATGGFSTRATVATASLETVLSEPALLHELFGPFVLVVGYDRVEDLSGVLEAVAGSLTVTVHGGEADAEAAEVLEMAVPFTGRIVWNGFPTGVAIAWSMQHGGPFPASTAPSTTSVGGRAIRRFLRPVTYQDVPTEYLPPSLRSPQGLRRVDGRLVT